MCHVKRFPLCFANGIEISNPLRVRRGQSVTHQCMHNLPLDRNSLLLLCHRKGFHHLLQQPAAPILCYLLSSIYLAQTRWAWHFVIQVDFCSFLIPSWSSGMSIDFFFNWQLITCKAGKIDRGEMDTWRCTASQCILKIEQQLLNLEQKIHWKIWFWFSIQK